MDRRTFLTLVAGTCLLEPLAVRAQQTGKVFRIGLLAPYTEPTPGGRIDTENLRLGLRDLGWIEGKNLLIEIRWAGVNPQRQRSRVKHERQQNQRKRRPIQGLIADSRS